MALANNFIPQTSLVFGVRDFAPQIAQQAQNDTKALQNAFNFGTRVYDYMQGRKQADLIEQDTADRNALQEQIAADTERLEQLKQELAGLKGGI